MKDQNLLIRVIFIYNFSPFYAHQPQNKNIQKIAKSHQKYNLINLNKE